MDSIEPHGILSSRAAPRKNLGLVVALDWGDGQASPYVVHHHRAIPFLDEAAAPARQQQGASSSSRVALLRREGEPHGLPFHFDASYIRRPWRPPILVISGATLGNYGSDYLFGVAVSHPSGYATVLTVRSAHWSRILRGTTFFPYPYGAEH